MHTNQCDYSICISISENSALVTRKLSDPVSLYAPTATQQGLSYQIKAALRCQNLLQSLLCSPRSRFYDKKRCISVRNSAFPKDGANVWQNTVLPAAREKTLHVN